MLVVFIPTLPFALTKNLLSVLVFIVRGNDGSFAMPIEVALIVLNVDIPETERLLNVEIPADAFALPFTFPVKLPVTLPETSERIVPVTNKLLPTLRDPLIVAAPMTWRGGQTIAQLVEVDRSAPKWRSTARAGDFFKDFGV